MDIATAARKRLVSGSLAAFVVGLSLVGSMVFTDASAQAAVPAGNACNATEGKIGGRGSTFQRLMLEAFSKLYTEDVCGEVAEQFAGDPAGHNMVTYNYPKAVEASLTGSGAGEKAASCRTDAFAGTDVPYEQKQLEQLDGAPGEEAGGAAKCPNHTENPLYESPFQPKPEPWPGTNDIKANVMSFPIGGSSVSVLVHLTAGAGGSCPSLTEGELPTSIQLTGKEVSNLYGGNYLHWNEPALLETNRAEPGEPIALEHCTGPITRVVRQDSSGTTNIVKQFLNRVDNARTGSTCGVIEGVIQTWEGAYFTNNTEWPGLGKKIGEEGTCSPITHGEKSGNPELIKKLKETPGGFGYVDLAEASVPGIIQASVENATGTSFQAPSIGGGAANCTFTALSLPGSTAAESVGLNTADDWSNNNNKAKGEGGNGKPNHEDAADVGNKYPICGLTFELVYTGLHANNGEGKGAVSRLTTNQRRTLYSFFTFVLSSTGQASLNAVHYAPDPESWISKLQAGFQGGF